MYLGIEIGGTKLQLGLGRGDGRITTLRRFQVDPEAGAVGILARIAAEAHAMAAESGELIRAVGIGFGGPVDSSRGMAITSNQIVGWDLFPLGDWVRETMHVSRVAVENDADTAALGEARFGAGAGLSPILYTTIGSGIGGGLVIEGKIYKGSGLGAAEVGQLRIEPPDATGADARPLEQLASGWAIGRAAREALAANPGHEGPLARKVANLARLDALTAVETAEAAREGDPLALAVIGRAAEALGRGLAHAVTLLGPRRVILGGGVSLIGEELWLRPVRVSIDRRVFAAFRDRFDVKPAALGEEVVIQGALALALAADLAAS